MPAQIYLEFIPGNQSIGFRKEGIYDVMVVYSALVICCCSSGVSSKLIEFMRDRRGRPVKLALFEGYYHCRRDLFKEVSELDDHSEERRHGGNNISDAGNHMLLPRRLIVCGYVLI